jgi:hypothetical protein
MKVRVIYKNSLQSQLLSNVCITDGCFNPSDGDSRYCKKCRRQQRKNSKAWAERRQNSFVSKKPPKLTEFYDTEIGNNYLYAFSVANQAVKFGIASNVRKRKQSLQTANHLPLKTEAYIKCKPELEPLIHKYCRKSVLRGEWFSLNTTTWEVITLMKTKDLQGLYKLVGYRIVV